MASRRRRQPRADHRDGPPAPVAGRTSAAYGLDWVVGIVVLIVVAALVVGAAEADTDRERSPLGGWIKLVLGVLLLVLASATVAGPVQVTQR
jgi:hypothetical protein